jgi:hypothetical protein
MQEAVDRFQSNSVRTSEIVLCRLSLIAANYLGAEQQTGSDARLQQRIDLSRQFELKYVVSAC